MADFIKLSIFGTVFEITTRYENLQPVGMGAFGLVCSGHDKLTDTSVAIKKVMKPFSTPVLAKRTYRELKLLKHIRHENIICLSDIFISPLEDLYFVTELLGTDLHRLLTAARWRSSLCSTSCTRSCGDSSTCTRQVSCTAT